MKTGPIISAFIGGAFFAVPFFLDIGLPISLVTGVLAFGAGNLVFSDNKEDEKIDINKSSVKDILNNARKINSNIIGMVNKIEDNNLNKNIREIYQTAKKIIDTVEKDNKKLKYVKTFFSYYLPETYKLLVKYDEIENQKLGKSSEEFMKNSEEMIIKIKEVFKEQLAHLYQEDMVDTNAEMKVFNSVIKSDGYGESDFKL